MATVRNEVDHLSVRDAIECMEHAKILIQKKIDTLYEELFKTRSP